MKNILRTSLTRIANLPDELDYRDILRSQWQWGDYIVAEIVNQPGRGLWVEMPSGRLTQATKGDLLVGALGTRYATLELTGTWEAIGEDGRFHLLTAAGVMGKLTSISPYSSSSPMDLKYVGHLLVDEKKTNMHDFVQPAPEDVAEGETTLDLPVILIVGSSMSAGKTTAARLIIRRLKGMDTITKVLAGKLTGAGRYRDILTMRDAGADHILDFVDAGMPSTVCPPENYRRDIAPLINRMNTLDADVAVIEAGASPLEPYNGSEVLPIVKPNLKLLVLCASDPYSVVGMQDAFGILPDVIGGAACNTLAGCELVETLNQEHRIPAINFAADTTNEKLDALLREKLALHTDELLQEA